MPSVRPAVPDDAPAIARVHAASGRAAYQDLLPEDILDIRNDSELTQRWLKELQLPDPPGAQTIVVEEDDVVRGFARFGPPRDQDSILEGMTGELYGFYLHPDVWGRGLGRTLMEGVLGVLRHADIQQVTLNVVVGNERARLFYERLGWVLDRDAAPWYGAPQVRYRKEL